jgi:hypothetical protein
VGDNLICWNILVSSIVQTNLSSERDGFKWNLSATGLFTIRSIYQALINNVKVFYFKHLWKLKIPLKLRSLCGISLEVWLSQKTT